MCTVPKSNGTSGGFADFIDVGAFLDVIMLTQPEHFPVGTVDELGKFD
jgi:hypothetical protein